LNIAIFFHGFTKGIDAQHPKTMRKIARRFADGGNSIRRSCHGPWSLNGVDPPDGCGIGPRDRLFARCRPAAGMLLSKSVQAITKELSLHGDMISAMARPE
jgi:putative intracellular protease/amidase